MSEPPGPGRKGALSRAAKFVAAALNSKAGLIAVGFAFTGILTNWVAEKFKQTDDARQVALSHASSTQARVTQLNDFMNQTIGRRIVYTLELSDIFTNRPNDKPPDELWTKYFDAREEENVARSNIEIYIERNGYNWDRRKRLFSAILDNAINPTFDQLDKCLGGIHNIYNSGAAFQAEKVAAAASHCRLDDTAHALDECIGTFAYYFSTIMKMDESSNPGRHRSVYNDYESARNKQEWCDGSAPQANGDKFIACQLDEEYATAARDLTKACYCITDDWKDVSDNFQYFRLAKAPLLPRCPNH